MRNACIRFHCAAMNARQKLAGFFRGEEGGAGIIAAVILIAIVIVLGVVFKDRILTLFDQIWPDVNGSDFTATPTPK